MRTWFALYLLAALTVAGGSPAAAEDDGTLIEQPVCPGCEHFNYKIAGAPDLIFKITNWGEDNDASFWRAGPNGKRAELMDIVPVALMPDGTMRMAFWPGDLTTLVARRDTAGIQLMVAFHDGYRDETDQCHPRWQRRMPMVLFVPKPGDYDGTSKINAVFKPMSLKTLEETIRRPSPHPTVKTRQRCEKDGCCVFALVAEEEPPAPPKPEQLSLEELATQLDETAMRLRNIPEAGVPGRASALPIDR